MTLCNLCKVYGGFAQLCLHLTYMYTIAVTCMTLCNVCVVVLAFSVAGEPAYMSQALIPCSPLMYLPTCTNVYLCSVKAVSHITLMWDACDNIVNM